MNRLIVLCVLLGSTIAAAQDGTVTYVGGTVPGIRAGAIGRLDMAESGLEFEHKGVKLNIPYATMDSFEYSRPVAHQLGVLPLIAVGLFKVRQRRHIFRISFHEESGKPQVVILQVPKQMPQTLEAVFQTRTSLCTAYYKCQNAR